MSGRYVWEVCLGVDYLHYLVHKPILKSVVPKTSIKNEVLHRSRKLGWLLSIVDICPHFHPMHNRCAVFQSSGGAHKTDRLIGCQVNIVFFSP